MKRILLYISIALLICFIIAFSVLTRNTTFIKSPNQDFTIAEVCFDTGGAGYWGEFYLIDKRKLFPRIINTDCSSPGSATWISENEFYLNCRSGEYSFQILDDNLIKTENGAAF